MTYLSLPPRALLGGAMALAFLPAAQAESGGFFEDAKTSLTLRNYYFNRDFNDPGASKSKIEEWAQGAILKFSSGYTPGVIGFGLDGIAMLGVKLDSGPQRSGSELLPVHDDGHSADNYGRAGVAAKMRLSETELMLGELMPDVPLLRYGDVQSRRGEVVTTESTEPRIDYRKVAPQAVEALWAMERYARSSTLERTLLALVKLRASMINGCAYCVDMHSVDMHSKDARALGESEQSLYAVSVWREAPFFTPRERAALACTEAVTEVSAGRVSDEAYRLAREHFDERQLVDLTMAIIAIDCWNRLATAFRAVAGTYEPAKQHSAGPEVSP